MAASQKQRAGTTIVREEQLDEGLKTAQATAEGFNVPECALCDNASGLVYVSSIESKMNGNASWISPRRMITSSIQPPK